MFKIFKMFNNTEQGSLSEQDVDIKLKMEQLKVARERRFFSSLFSLLLIAAISFAFFFVQDRLQADSGDKSVVLSDYRQMLAREGYPYKELEGEAKGEVFVIDLHGFVTSKTQQEMERVLRYISIHAKKKDSVVINMKSPGGESLACSNIYHLFPKLENKDINVIVHIDDFATSCGYKLSLVGHKILAEPDASVGNIGVAFRVIPSALEVKAKQLGVGYYVVGSTRRKAVLAGAPIRTLEDLSYIEERAKEVYFEPFKKKVMDKRKGKIKEGDLDEIFSAKVFTSERALELGLVDVIVDVETFKASMLDSGYKLTYIEFK